MLFTALSMLPIGTSAKHSSILVPSVPITVKSASMQQSAPGQQRCDSISVIVDAGG